MKQKSPFPTIYAEIADLDHQIKALDLPGKIEREKRAISQHDNFNASNVNSPGVESIRIRLVALNGELQQARTDRISSERDVDRINRDLARLNALLDADDRAAQAHKQIEAAAELSNSAQIAVDAAQTTSDEINSLVATEAQALDEAKAHAAGAMLALVKSGKQGKLPPVSRDRLDALLMAQEAAAAELVDAAETLAQCVSNLNEARHELALAKVDCTARVLHLMAGEYAEALSNHKTAAHACGQYFDAPDLDALVRQLEHEVADD